MTKAKEISRRQFVASAITTAALATLPVGRLFAGAGAEPEMAPASDQPAGPASSGGPGWKDQGIENLAKSPHAKLRDIPVHAVTIQSGFWAQRRETNVDKSIPTHARSAGRERPHEQFSAPGGEKFGRQSGPVYSDSDIYKWIEAVGFVLQSGDRPQLRATVEKMIDEIVAAQEPSGYLNTYYVDDHKSERMLTKTQTTGHELYCLGHMLQGAIAYYRATGDRKLLDAGIRFVDDFLMPNYGPAPKQPIVSGHPEIELALIELYRITGDKRQLNLAGYILHGDAADEVSGAAHHLHVQRNSVYRPDQAGRPRGARDVRLLRRHRLLHGDRRPGILENARAPCGTT